MDENIFSGETGQMDYLNTTENVKFEIIVNNEVILKGYKVNELIELARRMYPDKPIGIKKSKIHYP